MPPGPVRPWSKVEYGVEADSPSSWNCWRREADAYESGFLHDLPGRLRAPRCFASHEFEPGLVGLWLEDVDDVQAEWSMAHFTAAASNLGELGGAFLADRPVPDLPWLSRGWLRGYVGYNAPMIELLQRSADDPWIRRLFPPEDLRATVEVWDEREWCFEVLARLPQTLCHMDAFSRNLFRCSEPDGEHGTVANDCSPTGARRSGRCSVERVSSNVNWACSSCVRRGGRGLAGRSRPPWIADPEMFGDGSTRIGRGICVGLWCHTAIRPLWNL